MKSCGSIMPDRRRRYSFSLIQSGLLCLMSVLFSVGCGHYNSYRQYFHQFYLDNDVKVLFLQRPADNSLSLSLAFSYPERESAANQAGIELLTLQYLATASADFNSTQYAEYLHRHGASISAVSERDMSFYTLLATDANFSLVFPHFISAFLQPAWRQQEFAYVKEQLLQRKREDQQKLSYLLSREMNNRYFSGHPYQKITGGSTQTIAEINLPDLIQHHQSRLTTNRMTIVVIGNTDRFLLQTLLEDTIGSMPPPITENRVTAADNLDNVSPQNNKSAENRIFRIPYGNIKDQFHIRANYPAPTMQSRDYFAMQLVNHILNEILTAYVVVNEQAATMSYSNYYPFASAYGSISLLGCRNPQKSIRLINDSISLLIEGYTLDPYTTGKELEYYRLNEKLEQYKKSYLTNFYMNQRNNSVLTGLLAYGNLYRFEPLFYKKTAGEINRLTDSRVIETAINYLRQAKSYLIFGDSTMINIVPPPF